MKTKATLTEREHEVTALIARGFTKKEIATHLHISVRTVENHARSIYEKTGCRNAAGLTAWWFCFHFNISLDLSPLVQKAVVVIAFVIYLFGTSAGMPEHHRARTQHVRTVGRTGRSRRNEKNYQYKIAA